MSSWKKTGKCAIVKKYINSVYSGCKNHNTFERMCTRYTSTQQPVVYSTAFVKKIYTAIYNALRHDCIIRKRLILQIKRFCGRVCHFSAL